MTKRKSSGKRLRDQRWRMWQKDSRCYYCHQETTWECPIDGKLSLSAATTEHLVDKLDLARTKPGSEKRHVLACNKCNNQRSNLKVKQVNEQIRKIVQDQKLSDSIFKIKPLILIQMFNIQIEEPFHAAQ